MSRKTPDQPIRTILERDRLWTAYALADLDPIYAQGATWLVKDEGVILHYAALQPAVLFLFGPPLAIQHLLPRVPAGPVQFMVRPQNRDILQQFLHVEAEIEMWRMALNLADFKWGEPSDKCRQLGTADLPAIDRLIQGHPDQPDAFTRFQLENGVFYGRYHQDNLVAIAGTHVLSQVMNVAAVGNVFTDASYRGQGFGREVSAAVVSDLVSLDITTIVLNVSKQNAAAQKIYRDLGFWPVYGYYEGVGTIH